MRRKDREITDFHEIVSIIKACDVCRIAVNDGPFPYIVPMNFGVEVSGEQLILYFHSAKEGTKNRLFLQNPQVSFEFDRTRGLYFDEQSCRSSMDYESVVGQGTIASVSEEEKEHGLDCLMEQYFPGKRTVYDPVALTHTAVFRLTVTNVAGKRKIKE